jgi:isoleucyl-tRNA synthetase
MFPTPLEQALNTRIEEAVGAMQSVVQLGRAARDRKTLPIKFPLTSVTVIHKDPVFLKDIEELKPYILAELNVKEVATTSDESSVVIKAKPDLQTLGKRLRKDIGKVTKAIKELSNDKIRELQSKGSIEIEGHTITAEELQLTREFNGDTSKNEPAWDDNVMIVLNLQVDETMRQEGLAREIINRVQRLRKKAGIHPTDPIEVHYQFDSKDKLLAEVVSHYRGFIRDSLGVGFSGQKPAQTTDIIVEEVEVTGSKMKLWVSRLQWVFDDASLKAKCKEDAFAQDVKSFLLSREYFGALSVFQQNGGKLRVTIDAKSVELELGKDVFKSATDKESGGK